ncbi:MAG TPA: folylpolyglutamate synthase/dihydrofolate synthase family protein [Chloroflexia bacterium]|nr:folylpolyglutamate synthase/dihydrofolate synthase family protein [Chloroflexia bacterium]
MRYKEAYSYLNSFTNYEKTPGLQRDLGRNGLTRVRRFMALLGKPQDSFKSIVVAGTKGKGSVAAMLDSALRETGRRVGLYTSPHLHTFRERIRVDGEMISPADVARLVETIQPTVERIRQAGDPNALPTTYELATALAFLYFQERSIDIAVLEVGLGGRLDAVNVATPIVSVITSISMDHMEVLGNTLQEIAREKAGIIKPNGIVVTAPQVAEAMAPIKRVASRKKAKLKVIGEEVYLSSGSLPEVMLDEEGVPLSQTFTVAYEPVEGSPQQKLRVKIPLMGSHQQVNAAVAVSALLEVDRAGTSVSHNQILRGLANVSWPGRLEVIHRHPTVVADGAHNAESIAKLNQALFDLFYKQPLIVVFGSLRDKDMVGMLSEIGTNQESVFGPEIRKLIVTAPGYQRAADPKEVASLARAKKLDVQVAGSVSEALDLAEKLAGEVRSPDDEAPVIVVTGSLYIVAEAREHYGLGPDLNEEE